MGAASKAPGKSNLPFGASPIILVLVGLALVALIITYLPGLFSGKSGQTTHVAPISKPTGSSAPVPAKMTTEASATTAVVAAVSPADELSSFLLRFGRANPFAATSASSGKRNIGAQTSNATIDSLRNRVEEIERGAGAGAGTSQEGFKLTGIVRYAHLSLAVITKDGRTYYVLGNEVIGKTGYAVRAINQDNVVIASGDKELVLSLRRNKP